MIKIDWTGSEYVDLFWWEQRKEVNKPKQRLIAFNSAYSKKIRPAPIATDRSSSKEEDKKTRPDIGQDMDIYGWGSARWPE